MKASSLTARLLTALACAVLILFCWMGTGQADPFQHGYTTTYPSGFSTGGTQNSIYHTKLTISSGQTPFILVGVAVRVNHDDPTSPTTDPPFKMALYNDEGTTVLDSTEVGQTRNSTDHWHPLNFTTHYEITSAGDYNIAIWGDTASNGDEVTTRMDSTTADTTWVMTPQAYGGAWPTLSDDNPQVNKHLTAYIIGIKGDAGIIGPLQTDDTRLASGANANKNYGAATSISMSSTSRALIRPQNVADNLGGGKTVDACSVWVYPTTLGAFNVGAYRVFKTDWLEGTGGAVGSDPNDGSATWNDWGCDANEWATAGCDNADDAGSDNTGDGTGADRKSTAESSISGSSSGWYAFEISSDLAQEWYDGTGEGGLVLISASGTPTIATSEQAGAFQWPIYQFYTSDVGGASRRRRVLMESQ